MAIIRKSLLNPSNIEYTDYGCNYYEGCEHGCLYPCYSRVIKKKSYDDWIRPEVVENALELLDREIPIVKRRWKNNGYITKNPFVSIKFIPEVMLCTMTDPYQPIDRIHHFTRKVILKLLGWGFRLLIQTKSPDVLNDLDILERFKHWVTVSFTIITLKENVRQRWEPDAPSIQKRIHALKILKDHDIHTRVSLEPILPNTPVEEVLEVFDIKDLVDEWYIGILSHKKLNESELDYYRNVKSRIEEHCKRLRINYRLKEIVSAFPD